MPPANPPANLAAQPRYMMLADQLRAAIERGGYRDNDPLPSERELCVQHEVSRDTVRKAVRHLEDHGVIYSHPGRGTFVAPTLMRNMSRFIDGFSQSTLQEGARPGQRILLAKTQPATLAIASLLGVDPGRPLLHLNRVRLVDNAIVGIHDAWFVVPRDSMIDAAEIRNAASIYELLQVKFGFAPTDAVDHLNAAAADVEDASLLAVSVGSPLLVCERVTFSERREPIEYCLMKYVQSYRYGNRLSRSSGFGTRG